MSICKHIRLLRAANTDNFDSLHKILSSGIKSDIFDDDGYAPLHYAVQHGNIQLVVSLLKAGANIDLAAKNKDEPSTPMEMAVTRGNKEVVNTLFDYAADSRVFTLTTNLLSFLISSDPRDENEDPYPEILEVLLKRCAKDPEPHASIFGLHLACRRSKYRIVEKLIEHGVNVNGTLLVEASYPKMTALHWAVTEGDVKMTELLLSLGASVDLNIVDVEPIVEHAMKYCRFSHLSRDNDWINRSYECIKLIIKHLAILQALGKPISSTELDLISNDPYCNSCLSSYLSELEKMKSCRLGNTSLTFFDLVVKKNSLTCLKNDEMKKEYCSFIIETSLPNEFHNFYDTIKQRFIKRLRRIELEESSYTSFSRLSGIDGNAFYFIVRNIVSYLNDEDLINMKNI